MNPKAIARLAKNAGNQTNRNPALMAGNAPIAFNGFMFFDHDQIFNGESFVKGDVLLGDNRIGQSNLKWVPEAGTWDFRIGTIVIQRIGVDVSSMSRADDPLEVEVTSGDVDLPIQDSNGIERSLIVITAAAGNFRIASIQTSVQNGKVLDIVNDAAHDMTIGNNVYAGSPPGGYTGVYTQTGSDVTLTTFSTASFRFLETLTTSGTQWFRRFSSG